MHTVEIIALVAAGWSVVAFGLGVLSGRWMATIAAAEASLTLDEIKRAKAVVSGAVQRPNLMARPTAPQDYLDELLIWKDGEYVPYSPPRFVPTGKNPVEATWDATHATGISHHTRRVQLPGAKAA